MTRSKKFQRDNVKTLTARIFSKILYKANFSNKKGNLQLLGIDLLKTEVQKELIQEVPRGSFQGIDSIEVGMQFEAQTGQGGNVPVTVTAVTEEIVTVDGNHPLAGKNLTFEVSIEDVRDATEEELSHGHVHGIGGHQH